MLKCVTTEKKQGVSIYLENYQFADNMYKIITNHYYSTGAVLLLSWRLL